jgi:hypothetical protein
MALITCDECGQAISDRAPACPRCGAPRSLPAPSAIAPGTPAPPPAPAGAPAKGSGGWGWIKWIFIVPIALFAGLMIIGSMLPANPARDAQRLEARKTECSKALLSSAGHSTFNYSDKLAYEQRVRDACEGLELNGKPIGR